MTTGMSATGAQSQCTASDYQATNVLGNSLSDIGPLADKLLDRLAITYRIDDRVGLRKIVSHGVV